MAWISPTVASVNGPLPVSAPRGPSTNNAMSKSPGMPTWNFKSCRPAAARASTNKGYDASNAEKYPSSSPDTVWPLRTRKTGVSL